MEIWKKVVGYETEYEVSDRGRVRSQDKLITSSSRNGGFRIRHSHMLKQKIFKNGYCGLSLCKDSTIKDVLIHRLVALAFLQKSKEEDIYVNHKNLKKNDNRVENLEWCTPLENTRHALANSSYPQIGILKRKRLRCIETKEEFLSSYQAAEWLNSTKYGNTKDTCSMSRKLRACATGKQRSAYGFKWEDVNLVV